MHRSALTLMSSLERYPAMFPNRRYLLRVSCSLAWNGTQLQSSTSDRRESQQAFTQIRNSKLCRAVSLCRIPSERLTEGGTDMCPNNFVIIVSCHDSPGRHRMGREWPAQQFI